MDFLHFFLFKLILSLQFIVRLESKSKAKEFSVLFFLLTLLINHNLINITN